MVNAVRENSDIDKTDSRTEAEEFEFEYEEIAGISTQSYMAYISFLYMHENGI